MPPWAWPRMASARRCCGRSFFSAPMLARLFVPVFPPAMSHLLMAVGRKDLPSTVVAIHGCVILIVSMAAGYALGQVRFSREQGVAVALTVLSATPVEIAGSGRECRPAPPASGAPPERR